MSGSPVTTSVGTLAMTLTSGVHLRLDASSTARLDSATDVWLERGAVYVDSTGAPGASPISIHTAAGLVRAQRRRRQHPAFVERIAQVRDRMIVDRDTGRPEVVA